MAVQPDGKIVLAGNGITSDNAPTARVARLNSDGSEDTQFSLAANPNGPVRMVKLANDGKMMIAGDFQSLDADPRAGLARLNTDGSFDNAFNPGTGANGGAVADIAVQPDGKTLVAGSFQSFGTSAKACLARLLPNGTVDPSFSGYTTTDGAIIAVRVQGDGKILIAGNFGIVNGTSRHGIARLNSDGSLDTTFDTGTAVYEVRGSFIRADGKIIVVGNYSLGTASRRQIFRLHEDGGLDLSFNAGAGAEYFIHEAADGGGGRVVVAGSFFTFDGVSRDRIVRLNPDGSVDALFDPGTLPGSAAGGVVVQDDGKPIVALQGVPLVRLLAIGTEVPKAPQVLSSLSDGQGIRVIWTDVLFEEGYRLERSPDGVAEWAVVKTVEGLRSFRAYDGALTSGTNYFYRVRAFNRYGDGPVSSPFQATTLAAIWPGQVNLSLDPGLVSLIEGAGPVLTLPDGKLIVAGQWKSGQSLVNKIALLKPDGRLERFLDVSSGFIPATPLLVLPDGKFFVRGKFSMANGTIFRTLALFNPDGSEDTGFAVNIPSGDYGNGLTMGRQADGKFLIGGSFNAVNGTACSNLARLNPDGSLDSTFQSATNGQITSLTLDSHGRVVIGGNFSQVNGAASGKVARLLANGATDPAFTSATGGEVRTLAVGPDDGVIVALRNQLIRLRSNGSLDTDFHVGPITGDQYGPTALLWRADGSLLVAGDFNTFGGVTRSGIVRLLPDGSVDPSFDIAMQASFTELSPTPDGGLIATGMVTFPDGTPQKGPVLIAAAGGPPPPAAPINVEGVGVSGSRIRVAWTPSAGAEGYFIERQLYPGGFTLIGSAPAGQPFFADSGLNGNTYYYYRITAYNAIGLSSSSVAFPISTLVPTYFQTWKSGYGLDPDSPGSSDGDADGVNDFLEFALGGNPLVPDRSVLPIVTYSTDRISLTYTKSQAAVEYQVETSTDLKNWTTQGVIWGTSGNNYSGTVLKSSGGMRFLRLKVQIPSF
ncbi:MAG: hypothetical protein V4584_01225 [Verrucomicrobiota bacterium]